MEIDKKMIKLGSKVKDKITGFTGVAVQKIEYLYGCMRYGVEGKVGKDGKAPFEYFDQQRLQYTGTAISMEPVETGGDDYVPGKSR